MNGVEIGRDCIIGAGALVTERTKIPAGHVAFGSPAKIVRKITEKEVIYNEKHAIEYVETAKADLKAVEV